MRTIDYYDLVYSTNGTINNASDIECMALKQLAKGMFSNFNNCIGAEVELTVDDEIERIKVCFHDSDSFRCDTFRDRVYIATPHEPCLDYLYYKTAEYRGESMVEMLNSYKATNIQKGSELTNEVWFKLYSPQPIHNGMRDLYHAKWIDYEAQLKTGDVIFDENHLNGLWAMPLSTMLDCFNEECMNRYGKFLFIVKPVDSAEYLLDGKEVIGDRFRVISKVNLSNIEDVGILLRTTISMKDNVYNQELYSKDIQLRRESTEKTKALSLLKDMTNSLQQCKARSLIFSCLSIVTGIVLGLLL